MSWSLCYPAQGGEAILTRNKQKTRKKSKPFANTAKLPVSFLNEPRRRTCSRRMLLSAVWSRSDTSTESIWLASSWRLCRHLMVLKWVTRQHRVFGFVLFFKRRAPSHGSLCTHLAAAAGDADDDVVVGRRDGGAVDGHAVHPLFVTRNSHGSSGEPEEMKDGWWDDLRSWRAGWKWPFRFAL